MRSATLTASESAIEIDASDSATDAVAVDAPPTPPRTSLALGAEHTCATGDDGVVACWGTNRNGELGVVKFKFYPERAEFVEIGKGVLPDDEGG